jgi:hypothetical protein
VIAGRVVVRLIGATVAGLAMLSGSVPAMAAGLPDGGQPVAAMLPVAAGRTGLQLSLTKVAPAAVGLDDEVVVTGTVRNLDSAPKKNVRIALWLRPQVLADREAIDTWLATGTLTTADQQLPDPALIRSLPAGQSAQFRIDVPPGQAGLFSGSSFGPRAIALQARVGGQRAATLRSTLVWAPNEITTPTRLSVLVPITSSIPSTHAGQPTAQIADELLPGGRLDRVLTAAHDPAMAWAVDPAVLTAASRLSSSGIDRSPDDADLKATSTDDPNATATTTKPSASATGAAITDQAAKSGAQDWLTSFRTEGRDRVFGLPYADPDVTSVLQSSRGLPLIRHSDALGRAAVKTLGGAIDTTLALPADGRINAVAARNLIRLKRTTVVLAAGAQRPNPEIDYTPTGRSTVHTSIGSLAGLLYDEQLSTLISAGASRTPAATQTLLAQLAAITMEQPGTTRHLLAVTPRTWNPDPTAVRTMMNALESAPWISVRGIRELQDASGPPRVAPIYHQAQVKAELPIGSISAAQVLDRGLTTFAPILVDPAPVQPLRERIASLLSVAWRQDRTDLVQARKDVADDVNGLVGGVRLGTSNYLFTARENKIPVTVLNKTNYKIHVIVRLKPRSGQLTFGPNEPVTVEPGKSSQVRVEAHAVASGNVVVEGKLLSSTGVALGPAVNFTVRVRPDWERWGMIVIGSLLGFLLVIGLLRGLRRNRTRNRVPIEAVPDVDELATQRAAEANEEKPAAQKPAQHSPAEDADADQRTEPAPAPAPEMVSATAAARVGGSGNPGGNNWSEPAVALPSFPGPDVDQPPAEPEPDPVPVPISPEVEPDPKAWGGPVEADAVRRPRERPRIPI